MTAVAHSTDGKIAPGCPVDLKDIDLFAPGAQEHWFEAYEILHAEMPIVRIPGEGARPGTDGFVITKYQDIADIIADPYTFPQPSYGAPSMGAASSGFSISQRFLKWGVSMCSSSAGLPVQFS